MPNRRYEDPEFAEAAAPDPNAGDETAAEQSEAAAPAEVPADEAVMASTAVLEKERDTLKEQLLRAVADFDNYRKRIERERRELSDYAATDVLLELLPIIDNFERALQAPAGGDEAFKKGVELIHKQMLDLLRKRGVTLIDALGADFDPNIHQAVIHEPSDDHREGEVMQELQRGYKLGDRLLRPAMVKVAKRS
ncbi:MAG TPA: nucleotide exchange factor GrpE [Vicinamibacterales bacterium]|nr:nucleotide exchange factor GrpE [Vicinamibacterales bacterium]